MWHARFWWAARGWVPSVLAMPACGVGFKAPRSCVDGKPGCDARPRRVVHWMLDPETGAPWASAEAVVISFDLDTRKVVDINPDAQAAFMAKCAPGLAL